MVSMSLSPIAQVVVILMLQAGCAQAQSTSAPAKPQSPPTPATSQSGRNLDAILDALDARGRNLKDLSADVSLTTTDTSLGESSVRSGTLLLQNQADGDTRIHIVFDQVIEGNKIRKTKTEYLLADEFLYDRNYTKKQQVKRQVREKGEKTSPIKLGEGPFPLPIGQSKEEVYRQFDVELPASAPDGETPPPDTEHVRLIPHKGTRMARQFPTIDIWVDTHNDMPVRISVPDKNGTSTQTTNLRNVKINEGVPDNAFELSQVPDGWSQTDEEYRD